MPWLPLALILVAALTIASLILILFPPDEGGPQVAKSDITDGVRAEATEDDVTDADEAASGANLAPPPPGDAPSRAGEDEEPLRESGTSSGLNRRAGESSTP